MLTNAAIRVLTCLADDEDCDIVAEGIQVYCGNDRTNWKVLRQLLDHMAVSITFGSNNGMMKKKGDYPGLDLWRKRFYRWVRQGSAVLLCVVAFWGYGEARGEGYPGSAACKVSVIGRMLPAFGIGIFDIAPYKNRQAATLNALDFCIGQSVGKNSIGRGIHAGAESITGKGHALWRASQCDREWKSSNSDSSPVPNLQGRERTRVSDANCSTAFFILIAALNECDCVYKHVRRDWIADPLVIGDLLQFKRASECEADRPWKTKNPDCQGFAFRVAPNTSPDTYEQRSNNRKPSNSGGHSSTLVFVLVALGFGMFGGLIIGAKCRRLRR